MKLELSIHIFEKYSNLMKIRSVTAELFYADRTDRQTDMAKLIVAFSQFCERA